MKKNDFGIEQQGTERKGYESKQTYGSLIQSPLRSIATGVARTRRGIEVCASRGADNKLLVYHRFIVSCYLRV
ncbi:hypothetical protein J6590_061832 [Homalodisca vitripennis]|nr:hypothetical protein J6590_061832 [Homalodisca vitripennis]